MKPTSDNTLSFKGRFLGASACRIHLRVLIYVFLFLCHPGIILSKAVTVLGGELAAYDTLPFTPNVTHRQSVCERYDLFRENKLELRYALENMTLRPLMSIGEYFNYSHTEGIHKTNPGLMAELLDDVAARAGFTWRQSFGVMESPATMENRTFTDALMWGVETYDVAINWWDLSVERMEKGVAYIEPWFDGSVVLIDRVDPLETSDSVNLLNWLRPFEGSVWLLTVFTVLMSGLVYQFLEYMCDERHERTFYQWFSDNLYLSSLNFTQNFEYAPNDASGRMFAVSMGIWALVMTGESRNFRGVESLLFQQHKLFSILYLSTHNLPLPIPILLILILCIVSATYTANLASLFVEEQRATLEIDTIVQAIAHGIPICTYENTNADFLIKERYKNADRRPKPTELGAFQALKAGECGLVAGYKDNWLGYQSNSQYNPDCDLEWVGREQEIIKSGFAVKADAGHLCTSFIRDVINLHLTELISGGILAEIWKKHRSKTSDIDCAAEVVEEGGRRLRNSPDTTQKVPQKHHRKLKGAARSAAADPGVPTSSLTIRQMAGTFVLHYGMMAIAVVVSVLSSYYQKSIYRQDIKNGRERGKIERQIFRSHGPIIGSAPRVNTSVTWSTSDPRISVTTKELLDLSCPPGDNKEDDPLKTRNSRRQSVNGNQLSACYEDEPVSQQSNNRRDGFSRVQSYYGKRGVNTDLWKMSSTNNQDDAVPKEEWRSAHDALALQMQEVLGILKTIQSRQDTGGGGLEIARKSFSSHEAPF